MKLSTLLALSCVTATLTGCNNDRDGKTSSSGSGGDDDGGDDDGGGFWAVGENGAMVRLTHAGEVSTYPLDATGDLRAIACKGAEQAVAVGEEGLLVVTFDGGASWDTVALAEAYELRAVALSGGAVGYAVGDGVVLRSLDDSKTWTEVAVAANDWSAVTTTASGATAWLTAGDEIWRLRDETLERVFTADGPLAGISVTPDGDHAVAVGAAGLLVRSDDEGESWVVEPPRTTRDLQAVRIAGDASLVLAVGEAGAVVRIGEDDASASEQLDAALSLRALHLSQTHGHAVGDHGTVLVTHDDGVTWEPVDIGMTVDLLGLDDLHGEPHL